ncbi:D-arabinono-1,4-lactone oxidase, partial [Streptomyces sp. NPDC055709]
MTSTSRTTTENAWRNWAGTVTSHPVREVTPASAAELAEAVRRAAEDGLRVKTVGTGHSFTAIAATDGVLVRPDLLTGIREIDRTAMTVTVEAGTPLKRLNTALAREDLSLTNMGDIMEQTVAGATSTGTHGTGRDSASIAAQIRGLELITADGSVLTCSEKENPEVFAAARIGLGALGVVSAITFAVEPLFLLAAREEPMTFDRVTAEFDELHAENEHFEFYWFPHTGNCNTKRNNRSAGPAAPPGAVSGWIEDELLSNGLFQVVNSVGRAIPATIPAIAKLSSRALSARTYTDIPYKVFTSPRRVRFVEMEYALPREAAVGALREVKAMIDRSPLRISFPVEVRTAPADDIALSTASGRESAYIAVHMYKGTP